MPADIKNVPDRKELINLATQQVVLAFENTREPPGDIHS